MANEVLIAGPLERLFGHRYRIVETFRAHGALTPATSKTLPELGLSADPTWLGLVAEGRVREGPAGQFYLFEPPRPSTRQRAAKLIFFYTLIVLIPFIMFALARRQ